MERRVQDSERGIWSRKLRVLCFVSMLYTLHSKLYALRSMLLALCPLLLALSSWYGCSPPADYYQQVLEMEEYGEQTRRDTGRHPGEVVVPVKDSEPVRTTKPPAQQLTRDAPQQQAEEISVAEQEEVETASSSPPGREVIRESPPSSTLSPEPVAIASDVIKDALNSADLGLSIRTVELVNGRLSGGKNSVRVSFASESINVIDRKFVTVCAVIYHLNEGTNTVDIVVGIAEDEQGNLLAILQSNMSDVTAWMTSRLTRAEWFSRVTKKIL